MRDALRRAARKLNWAGVPDAGTDARFLLAFAMGRSVSMLTLDDDLRLGGTEETKFENAVELRLRRKPVSQIVGYRAFWKQEFAIDCNVLDPRPESEFLVEQAIGSDPIRILDLGTGSGCILLAILSECPGATGVGVDCSADALEIAFRNAGRLGLRDRAAFCLSNWFAEVKGKYDLIVSNPPYVSESEYSRLDPEIRDWEPEIALKAGESGLEAFREIAGSAREFLAPGGELHLEIGRGQERDVQRIFEYEGYSLCRRSKDLDQRVRVQAFRYGHAPE